MLFESNKTNDFPLQNSTDIPNNMFVDISITCYNQTPIIGCVVTKNNQLYISIEDVVTKQLLGYVSEQSPALNKPIRISEVDDRFSGYIVLGELVSGLIQSNIEIDSQCITKLNTGSGISSINDDTGTSEILGNLSITASGLIDSHIEERDIGTCIVFERSSGLSESMLYDVMVDNTTDVAEDTNITSILNASPDSSGNLNILTSGSLEAVVLDNSLRIRDTKYVCKPNNHERQVKHSVCESGDNLITELPTDHLIVELVPEFAEGGNCGCV